ncbi:Thiol-Disulfide Isomerase [Bacteroidales bacterium CF]|jgi:Peroxiredoxin|nr:Thiol-Disulfide Isomerase [Bacteroidales bacterium CF]
MIRKKLLILFLFIGVSLFAYSQQREKLERYIEEYLSMTPPVTDSLITACDYLIGFSEDTLIKTHIAGYLFDRFYSSKVMGMESVAIHIAKNYFINKKLEWKGEDGMLLLRLFVEFNEHSLIGMDAPELNLEDTSGNRHSLRGQNSKYTVVYFFDTDCSLCKKELPGLKETIKKYEGEDVGVYAVYTQSDVNRLKQFIQQEFPAENDYWTFTIDPDFSSGFHKLYNVLKTPQIFLLDNNKKIIGRNLDHNTLSQLLESATKNDKQLSQNINAFLNDYLKVVDISDTSAIRAAIEPLFSKSIEGGPDLYRLMFLRLFDILQLSDDTTYQKCALFVAENYITNRSDLWWDNSVPGEYVPKMAERIKRNMAGAIANDFTFYTKKMKPVRLHEIDSKYTILYFYSPKCAVCKPFGMDLKSIYKSLKKRGAEVIAVDVESDLYTFKKELKNAKAPWQRYYVKDEDRLDLFYKFRKEEVPMIYLLDSEKRIIAKKINTKTINTLVK